MDLNAPANLTFGQVQNLEQELQNLKNQLQNQQQPQAHTHQHTVRTDVTAVMPTTTKQDYVIFMVEKSATICPFSMNELPFPDNLYFGKNVKCKVTLFSTKAEIQEALTTAGKGYRADHTSCQFIGLAVLLNTA